MNVPVFAISMLLLTAVAAPVRGADAPRPVKLTSAQIGGSAFGELPVLVADEESELGPFTTEDAELYLSGDKRFNAGMYRAGPNRYTIDEPYGVDEFMYFLKGGVTLTSTDGSRLEVTAGEAVVIPRGWRGVWQTEGYTKIYVIFDPAPAGD